jgi:MFS family permease
VASAIFMQISGRVFDRIGVRVPVLFGMTLVGIAMWLLSGLHGMTSGVDLLAPMVALGAGMGSMIMPLNTHLLNVAPAGLVGRVTSLTSAMQNVIASLAIATFATVLQSQIPTHVTEATIAASGVQTPALLQNATALAFGDVYRIALIVAALGWCLVWTLRQTRPAALESEVGRGSSTEREPLLVGS